MPEPVVIDVRQLPPRERHPLIFRTFDGLTPHEAFLLINDHDPKPLYYQFQAERATEVTWEPEEEGPERWVIRIGKRAPSASQAPATQPLRDEHADLLPHVAALQSLGDAAAEGTTDVKPLLEDTLDFLQQHLLPHAAAEEAVLYPEVARLLGGPQTTATMRRDHEEVQRIIRELAALASSPALDQDGRRELQRIAYGLNAILRLHFAKEEAIYLPLLDAHLDATAAEVLFSRMEAAAGTARDSRS